MIANENQLRKISLPNQLYGSPFQRDLQRRLLTDDDSESFPPPMNLNSPASSISGRSHSICSTCSSDYISDSEEEDASTKWPWIEHIQENGDLFYIYSSSQQKTKNEQLNIQAHLKALHTNETREKRIQEKIKNVIKLSKSLTKKDQMHIRNGSTDLNSHKQNQNHKKKQINESQINNKYDLKRTEIETKISETLNLICKNVSVNLNEKVADSFVTLENVLGIISGLDFDPVLDDEHDNNATLNGINEFEQNPNSIVVQGIIPNSPVAESESVLIGDIMLAINGTKVNHSSINDVLSIVNGEAVVIITIERLVQNPNTAINKSQLCSIVSNTLSDHKELVFNAYNEICVVTYLTLMANEDDANGDILFWYPESDLSQSLRNVRGVFLTLNDIMKDVTGTSVQSSVLVIDGKLINVSYENLNGNVFLVAVPAERCSILKLTESTKNLLKLLELINGDLTRVFTDEQLHSTAHLISMFLDDLLDIHDDIFLGIRQLQLPPNFYVDVSNVLCDAEAADYGECTDDFFPHRRLYGTIGTCLFYQDTLVCSHLTDDSFKDVIRFCKYHWLFQLAKKELLHQLVIWKEIHPTEFRNNKLKKESTDFEKPSGVRWFILVVGQGKSILCTLFEVGAVAAIPEGNPGPHPYYVDTACSILAYLIDNLDFEGICQSRLEAGSLPAVVKPFEALHPKSAPSPRALELIKRKVPAHLVENYNVPITPNSSYHQQQLSMDGSIDYNFIANPITARRDSRDSTMSGSSSHTYNGFRYTSDSTSFKSLTFGPNNAETSMTSALSTKLTAGVTNTLFSFCSLNNQSGVFICPNIFKSTDALTSSILKSFYKCCERIHNFFKSSQKGGLRQLEHGVMFRSHQTKGAELKKGSPNIKYWVVGRLVKCGLREEEIYVCFQDGVPQDMIELSFKIRYGCYY